MFQADWNFCSVHSKDHSHVGEFSHDQQESNAVKVRFSLTKIRLIQSDSASSIHHSNWKTSLNIGINTASLPQLDERMANGHQKVFRETLILMTF